MLGGDRPAATDEAVEGILGHGEGACVPVLGREGSAAIADVGKEKVWAYAEGLAFCQQ